MRYMLLMYMMYLRPSVARQCQSVLAKTQKARRKMRSAVFCSAPADMTWSTQIWSAGSPVSLAEKAFWGEALT